MEYKTLEKLARFSGYIQAGAGGGLIMSLYHENLNHAAITFGAYLLGGIFYMAFKNGGDNLQNDKINVLEKKVKNLETKEK